MNAKNKPVIIVLDKSIPKKEKKPIQVTHFLNEDLHWEGWPTADIRVYKYIELVVRNYIDEEIDDESGKDLIFVYDDPKKRSDGLLFLGNWNDVFVV